MDNVSVISLSSSSDEEDLADVEVAGIPESTQSSQHPTDRLHWLQSPKMQEIIRQIEASTAARRQLTEWACPCRVCKIADRQQSCSDLTESEEEHVNLTIRVDFKKNAVQTPCLRDFNNEVQERDNVQTVCKRRKSTANGSLMKSPELDKREFCTYLQLRNSTDPKHKEALKEDLSGRRSARVKNKQKEEIKTRNKVISDKSRESSPSESSVDVPLLTTLEDLTINMDRCKTLPDVKNNSSGPILPLPEAQYYMKFTDFEESMGDILEEVGKFKKRVNGNSDKNNHESSLTKKGKFKFTNDKEVKMLAPKRTKGLYNWKRLNSLRSKRDLKNVSVDGLLLPEKLVQFRRMLKAKMISYDKKPTNGKQKPVQLSLKQKQKPVRQSLRETSNNELKTSLDRTSSVSNEQTPTIHKPGNSSSQEDPLRCEIITPVQSLDDNADLRNFVDDMLELDHLSEEHRRSLVLSRIFFPNSIANCVKQKSPKESLKKACKIFTDVSNDDRIRSLVAPSQTTRAPPVTDDSTNHEQSITDNQDPVSIIMVEHNYSILETDDCSLSDDNESEEPEKDMDTSLAETFVDIEKVPLQAPLVLNTELPLVKNPKQFLHSTPTPKLFVLKRKSKWATCFENKKSKHAISIRDEDGLVLGAFYVDHHLVVCQRRIVSFWTQSALGSVLGAQNMWIPLGVADRPALHTTYQQKSSREMVVAGDGHVAYVELWMKEHKSDFRERPIADVFVMVYFWKQGMKEPDKKALQLENIKSNPDDVQYVTVKAMWPATQPRIVTSWHSVNGNEKKTEVHSYLLAKDFQTVASVLHFESVSHYVSSLHIIEDCDNLVLGSGENKMTLWHLEGGYIVATITLDVIEHPVRTLWAKYDKGFFFTLQEEGKELRLMAVNSLNNWSWKKLQTYQPPQLGFDHLCCVYLENGILVAFYKQGILCWNAQSGEPVMEVVLNDMECIPSGKYMITILDEQIIVKHALSHLLTAEDT